MEGKELINKVVNGISKQINLDFKWDDDKQVYLIKLPYPRSNRKGNYYYIANSLRDEKLSNNLYTVYHSDRYYFSFKNDFIIMNVKDGYDLVYANNIPVYNQLNNKFEHYRNEVEPKIKKINSTLKNNIWAPINLVNRIDWEIGNYKRVYEQGGLIND